MFRKAALLAFSLLAIAHGQQPGTNTAEVHPALPAQHCTTAGGCTTVQTSVTLDSNWRWVHTTSGYTNCYTGNTWDATICADPVSCAQNCALDGADYVNTYGITASGNALTVKFVTGTNVGSRVYLMQDAANYQLFKLMNQEFSFDVDMSNLPCGLNGAVYLVEMAQDGGMSKFPNNKAGAKYGTGYCDSQCPTDIKFINGEANILGWAPSSNDANAGSGQYGTCCNEMDIWEANSMAAAFTPHPCSVVGQTRCSGSDCGAGDSRYDGMCDPDGCDFNSFRQGDTTFLGPGKTVDTTKKFSIVTQFISTDGTANGDLAEIRRFYVQNGKVIPNSVSSITGIDAVNSITDNFCEQQKTVFGDTNRFATLGGLKSMGDSLKRGMVLALSLWDDYAVNMLWLDSNYPTTADPTAPGVSRGTCSDTTGVPKTIESQNSAASVIYSNIKFGDLNTTFTGTPVVISSSASGSKPSSSSSVHSSSSASSVSHSSSASIKTTAAPPPIQTGTASQYGQCGGIGWAGPTVCAAPFTCKVSNPYYSQCL